MLQSHAPQVKTMLQMATLMKKHVAIAMLFLVFEVFLLINDVYGELQKFEYPTKADGSLSVMVIGDWGRRGKYNQSRLAYQMGVTAEKKGVDFVISTGDNFYPSGLTSENDPAFAQSFSNVYTAPSLQKPWFSVLGNHDYRGNAVAQLSPILKHRDDKWFCLRSFIVNTDIAEFFFIDTTPFQDKYFSNPEDHVYDWRGILPREKYLSTLIKDLEAQLKESSARWKIVVGHHTIKSAGIHGNTVELVNKVLPILQENNVDLYINGHDHCLEHICSSDSPLQFLTSGGGSKAWRGSYSWADNLEDVKFYYDGQGFMTMDITPTEIHTNFYDINGKILHDFGLSKPISSII